MFKETDELKKVLDELERGEVVDFEAPLSSLSDFKSRFENALEVDEGMLNKMEPQLIDILSSQENFIELLSQTLGTQLQTVKERNAANRIFDQLLQLFADVDAVEPNKAVELIESSGILGSMENRLEGHSLVAQLDGLSGEKLARKVISIAPTLIEDCYKVYLSFLVSCKYVLSNENKYPSKKLGGMPQQVESLKSNYPLLLHKDIVWLRNAASHRNWKYDVTTGQVILWDNNTPKTPFSPDKLMEKIVEPFFISSQIFFDASFYYKLKLMNEALEKHLKALPLQ
ncbi:hypothetical protein L2729_12765 [Shewanella gelidimarina]|uniref:hypothetical protein n=1 Tax=Shewanella gelidimarina TaxID=56813 RepID=UPI002010C33D|nr:hypothetical protein [Shewanella gelidimarina]MCL1058853.1 hypothetical protein [Shewanella gelidimarina]